MSPIKRFISIVVGFFLGAIAAYSDPMQEEICKIVNAHHAWPLVEGHPLDIAIAKFYRLRKCRPLFHEQNQPTYKALVVAKLIGNSEFEGLHPELYQYSAIYKRMIKPFKDQKGQLDILLTKGLVSYILDLNIGIEARHQLDSGAYPRLRHILNASLSSTDLKRYVERHAPAHKFYARLKRATAEYLQLRDKVNSSPESFPFIQSNQPSDLGLVRKRLHFLGDDEDSFSKKSTTGLTNALKRFQKRHGLYTDGILGKRTLQELNIPPQDRLVTLAINMDRWRRLAGDPGGDDIIVNLAGFTLSIYEHRRLLTSMKVVVGQNIE